MISASKVVYNNSSRVVPLGNQIKPQSTPYANEFDSGIKKNLYQLPVQPFADKVNMLHGNANFLNSVGEILPCYVSPSLMLNRTYTDPSPIKPQNALQPGQGNAKNQMAGLLSDPDRSLLFKRNNFIPDATSAGGFMSKPVRSSA